MCVLQGRPCISIVRNIKNVDAAITLERHTGAGRASMCRSTLCRTEGVRCGHNAQQCLPVLESGTRQEHSNSTAQVIADLDGHVMDRFYLSKPVTWNIAARSMLTPASRQRRARSSFWSRVAGLVLSSGVSKLVRTVAHA